MDGGRDRGQGREPGWRPIRAANGSELGGLGSVEVAQAVAVRRDGRLRGEKRGSGPCRIPDRGVLGLETILERPRRKRGAVLSHNSRELLLDPAPPPLRPPVFELSLSLHLAAAVALSKARMACRADCASCPCLPAAGGTPRAAARISSVVGRGGPAAICPDCATSKA